MKSVSSSLIHLSTLPPEGVSEVEVMLDGEPQSVIVLREGPNVRGWLNICPHGGRRLDYVPGKFIVEGGRLICAAHGASFELSEGLCVAGPCRGQSLRAVPLAITG